MMKNLFDFEKFIINEALFDQYVNKYLHSKTNSLLGSNIQYSVTIHINPIQIRPNSLGQTEFSHLPNLEPIS
jgi:hypothetical protein